MPEQNKRPGPAGAAGATEQGGDSPGSSGRQRPDADETIDEFVNSLRELRAQTGTSFGDIARHGPLPRSTAHAMVKPGAQLPARREQVEQFVLACGQSTEMAALWVQRWGRLRSQALQHPGARTKLTLSRTTPLDPLAVTVVAPQAAPDTTNPDTASPDTASPPPPRPRPGTNRPPTGPEQPRTGRWRPAVVLLVYTLLVVSITVAATLVVMLWVR